MALELLTPFTKVELEEKKRDTNRKQIGIMGGNFNPVHNAHLVVADQVRQQLCLDQVLLMPEFQPPHIDKKETIDEQHRLKMLELAIEGIDGLSIEPIEIERKGISYTYDTMKLLIEKIQMLIIISLLGQIWWNIYLSGIVLMNLLKWCSLLVFNVQNIKLVHHIPLFGWICH